MIARSHSFTIKGEKFTVEFPNIGKLIDIESLKQAMTNNRYGAMAASGIASMYHALDAVDAIVFFQVVCPSVLLFLRAKDFSSLSQETSKELVEVYKDQILPWYSGVMKELYDAAGEQK